jgi:hypothetical protein
MTKEIYLSPLFSAISPLTPHKIFHEIDSIPNNCDLVGIAYFHHDIPVIKQQLRTLQQKTKQLIVYFEEFNDPCVFEILNDPEFCDCKFFYNIVLTNSPVDNKTVISWTCSGHNVYADSWAQDLISQIKFSKSYRKRFDCLLGRARGHRDFIAEFYEQSLFKNDIIFSYYKEDKFKEHGIWSKDIDQYSLPPQVILPVDIYNQSCFSIIAETCAYNNFSFFTEKTAKVIVGQRLFVMFAGKNYLKNFKKL